MKAWAFLWLCAMGCPGCAVGPDFERPRPPAVTRYTTGDRPRVMSADGDVQVVRAGARLARDWWRLFRSPRLDAVIVRAIENNPTLEAARASLRKSEYSLQAGYGVFFPQVDANLGLTRQRFTPSRIAIDAPPSEFNLFTLGGTISYTLDVFGGQRRALEGLVAQVESERYGVAAARLVVTGNIANAAIARAAYRAEIVVTQALVMRLKEQLEVTEARARAGLVPFEDVLSIRVELAGTRAMLPPLRQQADEAEHLLATLAGQAPGRGRVPAIELADLRLPRDLPVSLPSELVRQRPDIAIAEAALHTASANIGVATAALFPSFTLNGTLGVNSTTLGSLFDANSTFWSLGGNILAPLFHGGELWNQRKAAIEAFHQSRASYRETVLAGLQDVADSLCALEHDAELVSAESQAHQSAREALKLVEINYEAGVADYLQVLVADMQYRRAVLDYLQGRAQRLQDTVALFVALGGGWWSA